MSKGLTREGDRVVSAYPGETHSDAGLAEGILKSAVRWPPSPGRFVHICAEMQSTGCAPIHRYLLNVHEDMVKNYSGNKSPMHIIFGPRKVMQQIDQYAEWKKLRSMGASSSHRDELRRFVKHAKICCIDEINMTKVNAYLDTINSLAIRNITLRAFTGFFQYCKLMGYIDIRFTTLTTLGKIHDMTAIHPLLKLKQVKRAKELRAYKINNKPMSYRAIKAKMESEDRCVYDVHSIYRWANYKLPDLSTGQG